MPVSSSSPLPAIEGLLADLIPHLSLERSARGRPEILPGALLWIGFLVCILRGATSQQGLWRLLSEQGLWDFPRIPVSAEAVRIRLARRGPAVMQSLSEHVTAVLREEAGAGDVGLAPFASGVYALDATSLDQVARTLPQLRGRPPGDARLLPGKLHTVFDVRRQQFATIEPIDLPHQNDRVPARSLLETVPTGSLILADLGYFGFRWFDDLTDRGFWYVSRSRVRTSVIVCHTLTQTERLSDQLVWLGKYRADKAGHLVRRIAIMVGRKEQVYLTNVLDPSVLSAPDAVRLYARRWDIELAFRLIKTDLQLHLLWSARWEMILTQIWGVIIIAQIMTSLRQQIATAARIDLFEVSLRLLITDLPYLVRQHGTNLIAHLASLPLVKGGYLRPSTRTRLDLPAPGPVTPPPPVLPRYRTPRYAGKQ